MTHSLPANDESRGQPAGAPAAPGISRRTLSIVGVPIGLVFLVMLNGQVFTNAILFLFCLTISTLLWLPTESSLTRLDRVFYGFVVALHLIAVCGLLMSLPAAYEYQQKFNDVRKLHRQRQDVAADAPRGASESP